MDVFRRLCLWFLLLSLPLQGLAAATLRHCPQGANHAVLVQAHQPEHAHHEHHAHHAHAQAGMDDHPGSASFSADPGQPASDHGCSLCALCGASAALRSVQASADFGSPGIVAAPEPSARWQGVTTRLPDKPPRG